MNIIIVGGGTAGLISALMLKKTYPHVNIKIIKSNDIGIVGVGESSTEHWQNFCDFIEIPKLDFITKANATFKVGVYFKNWSKNDFLHSINTRYSEMMGDYFLVYGHLISYTNQKLQSPFYWTQGLELDSISQARQFHFDTFELNNYLTNVCKDRNIEVIVDDLTHIQYKENNISSVCSDKREYKADFFLDCSGFKRFLTKDRKWKSYSNLPVNSAITFSTDEMDEYPKYTTSTAQDYGWRWSIPTQTRTGNGYVFSDSFIDVDTAHMEMEKYYGHKIDITKHFKFDTGRLEKAWENNCYAIGLSQSFIEPLEATSIGSIIQQMFCFLHFLPAYDMDSCNRKVNNIFDNIFDYVQAHYLTKKENTPFWKEIKNNLKLSDNLNGYLEMWKNRLPQQEDVRTSWGLFGALNYIQILHGLEWFNISKIRREYDFLNKKYEMENYINHIAELDKNRIISEHKTIITILKTL